jgi:hypothetical protein
MDNCWGNINHQPAPRCPGLRSSARRSDTAADFNECLNAVHSRVKFTREEEVDASIAFLDVHLTRLPNSRISTHIYCKPSNTNVILKRHSCQDPNTITSTFKSEICRAHRICTTPAQTKKEIDFTLEVFQDNGHKCSHLEAIRSKYVPPLEVFQDNGHKCSHLEAIRSKYVPPPTRCVVHGWQPFLPHPK